VPGTYWRSIYAAKKESIQRGCSLSCYGNALHGSQNHLWGNRFFARIVETPQDYLAVMEYIDKNPVKAGLTLCIGDYEVSGAYHIRENITGFVDYDEFIRQFYTIRQLYLRAP
jgi:putative transposase